LLEAADLGGEGGEAMTTTTIQEEMTTSTMSDSVRPAHINYKPFGQGEGGPFGRGEGGGPATVDTNLQGRVGDAADEEKIWTTAMENEKVRVRVTRRTAVAGGGAGAKTTMAEVAVEATAVAGGVDTGAPTTMAMVTMVTAMTMTRLNVCDASTEEKERPSNPLRMHATIK
jgi:hypothetical protein